VNQHNRNGQKKVTNIGIFENCRETTRKLNNVIISHGSCPVYADSYQYSWHINGFSKMKTVWACLACSIIYDQWGLEDQFP